MKTKFELVSEALGDLMLDNNIKEMVKKDVKKITKLQCNVINEFYHRNYNEENIDKMMLEIFKTLVLSKIRVVR